MDIEMAQGVEISPYGKQIGLGLQLHILYSQ